MPSGGYRPGAGRPRKNPIDKKLEGKPTFSKATLKPTVKKIASQNVMGRSPYQLQHEPILYGWLKTGPHKWYAGRSEATIWNFAKPKRNSDHPTSKPFPLCQNSCHRPPK